MRKYIRLNITSTDCTQDELLYVLHAFVYEILLTFLHVHSKSSCMFIVQLQIKAAQKDITSAIHLQYQISMNTYDTQYRYIKQPLIYQQHALPKQHYLLFPRQQVLGLSGPGLILRNKYI